MLKTLIIGASGYTGAELAAYIQRHPQTELTGLMVSANSADAGKCFSDLHPQFRAGGSAAGAADRPGRRCTKYRCGVPGNRP